LSFFPARRLFRSKNLFESPSKVFATAAGAGARVSPLYRSYESRQEEKQEKEDIRVIETRTIRPSFVKKKIALAKVCRELKTINRVSRVCNIHRIKIISAGHNNSLLAIYK